MRMQLEHAALSDRRVSSASARTRTEPQVLEVLSPFELHLMRHPVELQLHRDALAAAATRQQKHATAREHVSAFFEWMVRGLRSSAVSESEGFEGRFD
jgi:hypothetical protein